MSRELPGHTGYLSCCRCVVVVVVVVVVGVVVVVVVVVPQLLQVWMGQNQTHTKT